MLHRPDDECNFAGIAHFTLIELAAVESVALFVHINGDDKFMVHGVCRRQFVVGRLCLCVGGSKDFRRRPDQGHGGRWPANLVRMCARAHKPVCIPPASATLIL